MSEDIEEILEKPAKIPEKTRKNYENAYNKFIKWAQEHNIETYTEDVMLKFFLEKSQVMKISTLWAYYSMIKAVLNIRHNIQIDKYRKLLTFLRKRSRGYQPKKSKTFTKKQLEDFLINASNDKYLVTKVIVIFGVIGSCLSDELIRMRPWDVEDLGHLLFVKVRNNPNNRNNTSRSFTITGDFYLNLYREYFALRPKDLNTSRLFLKYINGKCHRQVLGIHKMNHLSKEVAAYLKLDNPNDYTGYSFRKSSPDFLIDNEKLQRIYEHQKTKNVCNEEIIKIKKEESIEEEELGQNIDDDMDTNMSLDNVNEIIENVNSEIEMEDFSEDEEICEKQMSSNTSKKLGTSAISNEITNDLSLNSEMSEDFEDIFEKPAKIPEKTRKIYEYKYNKFIKWAQEHNVKTYTEDVMLKFFLEKSKTMKISTLWSYYSMIKAELNIRHNIQIDKYRKLLAFLKKGSQGYKPKQAKTFTKKQLEDFLINAPNDKYLATKVIMIFGVIGSCQADELVRMRLSDVEDLGNLLFVKVCNNPNNRNNTSRSFTITGDFYLNLYREYLALRPKNLNSTRLFIQYLDGKCHRSVMGINKMNHLSKEVATYLNLDNQDDYNGYSFRKSSADFLIDNENLQSTHQHDAETTKIKEEEDVEEEESSLNINDDIDTLDNINYETEMEDFSEVEEPCEKQMNSNTSKKLDTSVINDRSNEIFNALVSIGGIKVQDCTNCSFNIKIVS